jgi:hypothetical protein
MRIFTSIGKWLVGASLNIFWLSSSDRRPAERENESFELRPTMGYEEDGEGQGRREICGLEVSIRRSHSHPRKAISPVWIRSMPSFRAVSPDAATLR